MMKPTLVRCTVVNDDGARVREFTDPIHKINQNIAELLTEAPGISSVVLHGELEGVKYVTTWSRA